MGQASRIEQCRNGERPYWYHYLKDVKKEDVDWNEFLADAPKRPFDPGVYSGWYGYLDYTDGPIANLGCHFIDLYHYITGMRFPASCVCNGGVFTWNDEHRFTCPDHVEALWVYPEGMMVAYSSNFGNSGGSRHRYFCQKGQLNLDNWGSPTYSADGGPRRDGNIRGVNEVKPIETPDHFLDWLQCMRSGQPTRAPIEAGYQHAVACLMAVESFQNGLPHNLRSRVAQHPQGLALRTACRATATRAMRLHTAYNRLTKEKQMKWFIALLGFAALSLPALAAGAEDENLLVNGRV